MKILSAVLLALAVSNVFAQEPVVSGSRAAVIDEEIVVTASSVEEPAATVPAAVTVIGRDVIERQGLRDVAELLREVPGISLARTGSPGKATSLFTRGGRSTHTLVLWNGIEISDPYSGGFDWGRFSTIGVDRVEVVRGPFSSLYGSNAVTGVINVLTAPAASRLRANVTAGERGLVNGGLEGSYVSGSFRASAAIEHRQDDGFDPNDDFEQDSANGAVRWSGGGLSAGLSARWTDYDLGIPFNLSGDFTSLVPSLERRQRGDELQLAVPLEYRRGDARYELRLSQSERDDVFTDPNDFFSFSQTDSRSRRAFASASFRTPFGTIIAGGEVEQDVVSDVSNFGITLDGAERDSHSFFLEDRYSKALTTGSSIELSLGVRYDEFDTFGGETSPRIAAAWIAGGNKFRAAWGRSFRAPSLVELYFPFSGNRDLEPERSSSFEAGYERRFGANGALTVTLFDADFDEQIEFAFAGGNGSFRNTGAAESRGVELGARADLSHRFRSSLSWTWLDAEDSATGSELVRRPRNSGSATLGYENGPFQGTVALFHNGQRLDVEPVLPFGVVSNKAYTTLDANVHYSLGNLTPYVKLENLTDERYEEVLGYRAPGRRVMAGVRWSME